MDPLVFAVFIILFLLSAFFSGTEIALMSLPHHTLESLYKKGGIAVKALKKIKANNDRLLITILIGNNLANVYTAALATSIAIAFAQSADISSASAIGIATGIVTFLLLFFGEIVPKSFATKNAVSISLFVAPIYQFLTYILFPIIYIIELFIKLFSKKKHVPTISDEEIESFMDIGVSSGTLEPGEYKKIKSILDLSDTLSEEIMTPRVKLDVLDSNITVGQALDYYIEHTHSRIPVYTDTIDNIESILTIRDILGVDKEKKLSEIDLTKALKVPSNKPISGLLTTFQKSKKHMAILMDEYGGVAGLLTLEDIIEEILGEIRDETDEEVDEIRRVGKDTLVAESHVGFEELLENFDLGLNDIGLDEKEFGGENISYIITHKLERFPTQGETLVFKVIPGDFDESEESYDIALKVLDIQDGIIGHVELRKELK